MKEQTRVKHTLFSASLLFLLLSNSHGLSKDAADFPKAVLSATTLPESRFQTGRVIYANWNGKEVDRSRPPMKWPKGLRVEPESILAVDISTQEAPFVAEIRAWKRLRRNGIPKGEQRSASALHPLHLVLQEGAPLLPCSVQKV